jgi:hypothetical protein
MPKRVTIRICPDGTVKADVTGFVGRSCADYIRVLEDMLDAEVVDSAPTAEYYLDNTIASVESDSVRSEQSLSNEVKRNG